MNKKILLKITLLCFAFLYVIQWNNVVCATQTTGLTNQYTYNIRNKNSGKCINVNYGTDANGTNVNQYTADGSLEQKFAIEYSSSKDAYKLYAYCSERSFGRVLDVYRPLQNGSNVDIWTDGDDDAQYWKIYNLGNGYYSIRLASNTNLAITAYGPSNGGGSGTSPTSAGNVFVSTYTGANNQQWSFENTETLLTWDLVAPNKHLYWSGFSKYLTDFKLAVNTWNNYKPGVIINESSNIYTTVIISDYTEANNGVVASTSANGTIRFNSAYMEGYTADRRINACIHELGHALRLSHRREYNSIVYPSNTTYILPNEMDKWNYDKAYQKYY